jgi:hypothetical protein
MVAKIRRLYDIANVLVSVGLIEKVLVPHCRKPLFRWFGGRFNPDSAGIRRWGDDHEDFKDEDDIEEDLELFRDEAPSSDSEKLFPKSKGTCIYVYMYIYTQSSKPINII